MRVVHIIPGIDPSLGGPVAALVGLARAQAAAGMEVTVAPAMVKPELPSSVESLLQAGIRVQPIIGSHSPMIGPAARLGAQVLSVVKHADFTHIYGLWEAVQHATAVICRQRRKPYIFEPCGMLDHWALRRHWLKKKIYMLTRLQKDLNHGAAIHVSTTWERDQVASLRLKTPLVVLPAGVELGEFKDLPQRGEFRQKHPQLLGKLVIMFLGRVFPGKGVEMLIPALSKMKNRDAVLAVVGPDSGGYTATMQALAKDLGVQDRVIFTGMARGRERIEALVDADLFSLPSEHENFGVAVLEAMAAGLPVVVSDQVGLCHAITQANAGEAVALDAGKLASVLDSWISDEPKCHAAGQRGRALAFEKFTWELIAREWLNVYKSLPNIEI